MSSTDIDFYTKRGAGMLCVRITNFWQRKGFHGIRAEKFHIRDNLWGVRSNIGPNGYPPRRLSW